MTFIAIGRGYNLYVSQYISYCRVPTNINSDLFDEAKIYCTNCNYKRDLLRIIDLVQLEQNTTIFCPKCANIFSPFLNLSRRILTIHITDTFKEYLGAFPHHLFPKRNSAKVMNFSVKEVEAEAGPFIIAVWKRNEQLETWRQKEMDSHKHLLRRSSNHFFFIPEAQFRVAAFGLIGQYTLGTNGLILFPFNDGGCSGEYKLTAMINVSCNNSFIGSATK